MTRIVAKRTSRALAGGLLGGLLFLLTACSSGDPASDPSPPAVPSPATGTVSPAVPSAGPSSAASTPATGAQPGVSAAKLCEYLTGQLPGLRAIGSEVGAMANLTANLFGWYGEQGAVPDGTELDVLTQAQCPDVRAEILTLTGIDSFTAL